MVQKRMFLLACWRRKRFARSLLPASHQIRGSGLSSRSRRLEAIDIISHGSAINASRAFTVVPKVYILSVPEALSSLLSLLGMGSSHLDFPVRSVFLPSCRWPFVPSPQQIGLFVRSDCRRTHRTFVRARRRYECRKRGQLDPGIGRHRRYRKSQGLAYLMIEWTS